MAIAARFNSTVNTVRRTRRAYIGAHVLAFEFAAKRASKRLDQLKSFSETLVTQGEGIESNAKDMVAAGKAKIVDLLPNNKASKTVDVTPNRVVKPAKRVDLSTDITTKPKAKPVAKAAKPAAQAGIIVKDKYAVHVDAATKYDADVNPLHIKAIVDHLGIALNSRDGKFVACSDAAERETVAKSWLLKKLGIEADMAVLDAKVAAVCETMKADRMKSRVTFYYLLAKAEGKLGSL